MSYKNDFKLLEGLGIITLVAIVVCAAVQYHQGGLDAGLEGGIFGFIGGIAVSTATIVAYNLLYLLFRGKPNDKS